MRLPRPIERAARFVAVPNLTLVLIAIQAACFILILAKPEFAESLLLNPDRVVNGGEWWRLVTFIFMPVSRDPIFAIFTFYFFYLMGTALEMNWGTVRYNVYVWIALLMSAGAAFIPWSLGFPSEPATNAFVYSSIFLAFAFLYPDFQIYIFFIIPVKIKWLALLTWLIIGFELLTGDWLTKALAIASVLNFLLFFWHDLYERAKHGRRSMTRQIQRAAARKDAPAYMHKCFICGITDRSNPTAEFRYCTECGGKCYCLDHLRGHVHNNLAVPT